MYWAVSAFGPNWKIENRIVQEFRCSRSGESSVCATAAVTKDQTVCSETVDLENTKVRAIALSKFAAVAKTLKTSSGQTLDVAPYGQVTATPESIEANADQFRDALSKQKYTTNPANLGVMSELTFRSFDDVETWPSNKPPSFTAAPALGELKSTETNEAF
jgi:hypothetical protein